MDSPPPRPNLTAEERRDVPPSTDSKIELFSDEDVHMSPRRLVHTMNHNHTLTSLNSSQNGTVDSSQTNIVNLSIDSPLVRPDEKSTATHTVHAINTNNNNNNETILRSITTNLPTATATTSLASSTVTVPSGLIGSDTDDGPTPLSKLLVRNRPLSLAGPGGTSSSSSSGTVFRLPGSLPLSSTDGNISTPEHSLAARRLHSFRYTGGNSATTGISRPGGGLPVPFRNLSAVSTGGNETASIPNQTNGTDTNTTTTVPTVSVSSSKPSHPSEIAEKYRKTNPLTTGTIETIYKKDPIPAPSMYGKPKGLASSSITTATTSTTTTAPPESEQAKKGEHWWKTYVTLENNSRSSKNNNTTNNVSVMDSETSDNSNGSDASGRGVRFLGKKRLAAERAKLTATFLKEESWTDTKILPKTRGKKKTLSTGHDKGSRSSSGRPTRATAVNARKRGFTVDDDDEGSFEDVSDEDADARKRRTAKNKKNAQKNGNDDAEDDFGEEDDMEGDDDDGSGSYEGSEDSDTPNDDDNDTENNDDGENIDNVHELGPPGIGSIGTNPVKITEADIEKLTQQAACLRHLKRGDRYRFAALWKKAHDIAGRLETAILVAHGVKKENGTDDNGSSSTSSTASSSISSLVTGEMLINVLGWGGVTTASAIASSGRAGTSSANDKVSVSVTSPSRTPATDHNGSNDSSSASSSSSSSASVTLPSGSSLTSNANLTLTPFQLVGLNWLLLLHREKLNGVLADEMGLGKSVQTLALLEWLRVTTNSNGPHLIVTPASTVSNWIRETKKWAPQLRIRTYRGGLNRTLVQKKLMYGGGEDEDDTDDAEEDDDDNGKDGSKRRTKKKRSNDSDDSASSSSDEEDEEDDEESVIDEEDEDDMARFRGSEDTPRSFDILVTTYTLFDRQGSVAAADRIFLRRYKWEYIICDEGHSLKNANGHRFRQLNTLQGDHRLLLSGTPIQNSIPELFSLLRFLEPHLFTRRIESIFTEDSKKKANLNSRAEKARLADLRRVLQPFILRRSKADVLRDLPPKSDETIALPMPPVHASQYAQVVELLRNQVMGKKASANINSALHANPFEGLASVTSTGSRPNRAAARKAGSVISNVIQQESLTLNQFTTGKGPNKRRRGQPTHESDTPVSVTAENTPTTTPREELVIVSQASYGAERSLVHPVDISIDSSENAVNNNPPNGNTSVTSTASVNSSSVTADTAPLIAPVEGEDLAVLRKASTKLSKTAANSLFGDLRKVSQHPLLLRGWYTHHPTLEGIAEALYHEGAFGFNAGCNPARVLVELEESSDWEIFEFCLHYGYSANELQKKQSVREVCKGKIKPEDGLQPITLLPNFTLQGPALLRAAAEALPLWAIENSAKLHHLKTWVPEQIQNGHRILIFSQLMATLSIIGTCFQAWGIKWLRLDGSTLVEERQSLLDIFTDDKSYSVFLLSTKAGGLGLNLTAADTVVLHDSDWNPHADAQAIDRAHRLGQTRPVRVQRLVTAGSLDERMARIAQLKLDLDRALRTDNSGTYSNDKKTNTHDKDKGLTLNVNELLLEVLSGGSIPMKEPTV